MHVDSALVAGGVIRILYESSELCPRDLEFSKGEAVAKGHSMLRPGLAMIPVRDVLALLLARRHAHDEAAPRYRYHGRACSAVAKRAAWGGLRSGHGDTIEGQRANREQEAGDRSQVYSKSSRCHPSFAGNCRSLTLRRKREAARKGCSPMQRARRASMRGRVPT
jgi:hypothetical protein